MTTYNKQLQAAVLDTVGVNGLDTQTHSTALDPTWFTKADNIVYTEGGKVTFRKGVKQKTISGGDTVGSIIEHKPSDKIFAGVNGTIYEVDLANPDTAWINPFTTGASASDWQFTEFDVDIYAFQTGATPLEYASATWSTVSTKPAGVTTFDPSCGLGHYGRMWAGGITEDKSTLYYTQIETPTGWATGDAGYVNLKYVWGGDEIVQISSYAGKLVIFGRENIAIYNNPWDVTALVLDEVIKGVGCVSRDSVQAVGNDLFFMSDTGVRSLQRTAEANQDKLPLREISTTVKDEMIAHVTASTNVKSSYVLDEGLYIVTFPSLNVTYVFDITYWTPRDTPRVSKWYFENDREPVSLVYSETYGLLFGQASGHVCAYEGYYDADYQGSSVYTNNPFTGAFSTVWIDLGNGYISSILKKMLFVTSGGQGTDAGLRVYKDFEQEPATSATFKLNPTLSGTAYLYGDSACLFGCNTNYDYGGTGFCSDGVYDGTNSKMNYTSSSACTTAGFTWNETTDTGGVDQPANCSSSPAKYAPIYGLKETGLPLAGDAKYMRFEMDGVTNGYKASLQSITLLYKQGKVY